MSRTHKLIVAILVLSCFGAAQSTLEKIWQQAQQQPVSSLSTPKITAGLKEALKVSTSRAVAETGKPDGFLMNDAIKILLPERVRAAGRGLRLVGQGAQIDELEVGMNRAAEQATPKAKQIFLNALTAMTIEDARHILSGGDTAATDYFREKCSPQLLASFTPIVRRSMENVGVVRQYDRFAQNPMVQPIMQSQHFDLDNFVVGKTMDGLFYMLGQEEMKIRKNPAARTTTLLKEVFGKAAR